MRTIIFIPAAFALFGCSITVPVRGSVQLSDETFTGQVTGYSDRTGILEVKSNRGAVCKGDYVFASRTEGEGVFTCSDGRSGPFTFVSNGLRGTGKGDLGNQKFIFSFGG